MEKNIYMWGQLLGKTSLKPIIYNHWGPYYPDTTYSLLNPEWTDARFLQYPPGSPEWNLLKTQSPKTPFSDQNKSFSFLKLLVFWKNCSGQTLSVTIRLFSVLYFVFTRGRPGRAWNIPLEYARQKKFLHIFFTHE